MSNKKTVKIKKKRFNVKRFLVFLLFFYLIIYSVVFLFNEPIRHIKIKGNKLVSDVEIIEVANLKRYPSIFKYLSRTIEKKVESLPLIDDAIVKKKWGFVLEIEIKENKPLFYNSSNDEIYLSNKKTIKDIRVVGIPTLVNYVKDDILNKFIEGFKEVDTNIIYEINEIYYDPSYDDKNEVIDEHRFRVLMNDGNQVYVTCDEVEKENKIKKLNYYNEIYASISDKKGYLSLDSGDYGNYGFIPYGSE